MSKIIRLIGLGILAGIAALDWWIWSGLFAANLSNPGVLIGFAILALVSFGVTGIGGIFGLLFLFGDSK